MTSSTSNTWEEPKKGHWVKEYPNGDQATIDGRFNTRVYYAEYSDSAGSVLESWRFKNLEDAKITLNLYYEGFAE